MTRPYHLDWYLPHFYTSRCKSPTFPANTDSGKANLSNGFEKFISVAELNK